MKHLAVIGHSLIHVRQHIFNRELSKIGIDVTLFSPGEWREQKAQNLDEGNFHIRTLRHFGGEDVYRFKFVGLEDAIREGGFDWIYVNQEPNSIVALDCSKLPYKKALFTWANIPSDYTPLGNQVLKEYDLVVCGNGEAQELVSEHNTSTVVLPQVGVDTVHFQARPVKRDTSVAYIGRATQEKGTDKLLIAWPTARVLAWQSYESLPWWYSMCKIVVNYSQDVPQWREQAMPYTSMEAICCGVFSIVSDAGSIPYWHREFAGENPGVRIVPQNSLTELKSTIEECLSATIAREESVKAGREWVEENLSSKVIAKRLVECLEKI